MYIKKNHSRTNPTNYAKKLGEKAITGSSTSVVQCQVPQDVITEKRNKRISNVKSSHNLILDNVREQASNMKMRIQFEKGMGGTKRRRSGYPSSGSKKGHIQSESKLRVKDDAATSSHNQSTSKEKLGQIREVNEIRTESRNRLQKVNDQAITVENDNSGCTAKSRHRRKFEAGKTGSTEPNSKVRDQFITLANDSNFKKVSGQKRKFEEDKSGFTELNMDVKNRTVRLANRDSSFMQKPRQEAKIEGKLRSTESKLAGKKEVTTNYGSTSRLMEKVEEGATGSNTYVVEVKKSSIRKDTATLHNIPSRTQSKSKPSAWAKSKQSDNLSTMCNLAENVMVLPESSKPHDVLEDVTILSTTAYVTKKRISKVTSDNSFIIDNNKKQVLGKKIRISSQANCEGDGEPHTRHCTVEDLFGDMSDEEEELSEDISQICSDIGVTVDTEVSNESESNNFLDSTANPSSSDSRGVCVNVKIPDEKELSEDLLQICSEIGVTVDTDVSNGLESNNFLDITSNTPSADSRGVCMDVKIPEASIPILSKRQAIFRNIFGEVSDEDNGPDEFTKRSVGVRESIVSKDISVEVINPEKEAKVASLPVTSRMQAIFNKLFGEDSDEGNGPDEFAKRCVDVSKSVVPKDVSVDVTEPKMIPKTSLPKATLSSIFTQETASDNLHNNELNLPEASEVKTKKKFNDLILPRKRSFPLRITAVTQSSQDVFKRNHSRTNPTNYAKKLDEKAITASSTSVVLCQAPQDVITENRSKRISNVKSTHNLILDNVREQASNMKLRIQVEKEMGETKRRRSGYPSSGSKKGHIQSESKLGVKDDAATSSHNQSTSKEKLGQIREVNEIRTESRNRLQKVNDQAITVENDNSGCTAKSRHRRKYKAGKTGSTEPNSKVRDHLVTLANDSNFKKPSGQKRKFEEDKSGFTEQNLDVKNRTISLASHDSSSMQKPRQETRIEEGKLRSTEPKLDEKKKLAILANHGSKSSRMKKVEEGATGSEKACSNSDVVGQLHRGITNGREVAIPHLNYVNMGAGDGQPKKRTKLEQVTHDNSEYLRGIPQWAARLVDMGLLEPLTASSPVFLPPKKIRMGNS
nr:uncharacterized protein LOC111515514 [Leptinotarsa decemlineata]